jgi:hypothetical protein
MKKPRVVPTGCGDDTEVNEKLNQRTLAGFETPTKWRGRG